MKSRPSLKKATRWEMVHWPEVGAAMCLLSLFVASLKRLFCEESPFPFFFFVNECDCCVTWCVRARDLTVSFCLAGLDCLFHSACLPLTLSLSTSAVRLCPPNLQKKRKFTGDIYDTSAFRTSSSGNLDKCPSRRNGIFQT